MNLDDFALSHVTIVLKGLILSNVFGRRANAIPRRTVITHCLRSERPSHWVSTLSLENIQNFHRKCRDYMFVYLEGHVAGFKLEEQLKKYKTAVTSHRRIGVNE